MSSSKQKGCSLFSLCYVVDKKSSRSSAKHDRSRFYTADPDLLLAFIYFDQSHAGYLVDKDVEEILFTLGLQLSRAQVCSPFWLQWCAFILHGV